MSPQKLGRYEITRVLGKGAMGIVYEGRDPNLDRRVAIKTVKVENLGAETAAEYEARFRTEARSAGRLQHPNIVSVYDAARDSTGDGDTAYLVMEFVHGDDLKQHIDRGARYSLDESARMMFDLLAALAYAHQHSIIHRDVKPANLLIEKSGRLKLTDFGVARIQNSGEATRTKGGMVGTLKYMAPEQMQGMPIDNRADLFAAGVVLYQLVTGQRPFDGDTDFAIMHQVVHSEPILPSKHHPGLPAEIDAVVTKALAKDRDLRYANAAEFEAALRDALKAVADTSVMPPENQLKQLAALHAGWKNSQADDGGTTGATATSTQATSGSSVTQELELIYWKDVRESLDVDELNGFLSKFPTGIYADLAKKRLKKLAEPAPASTSATPGRAAQPADDITRLHGDTQPLRTFTQTEAFSRDMPTILPPPPTSASNAIDAQASMQPASTDQKRSPLLLGAIGAALVALVASVFWFSKPSESVVKTPVPAASAPQVAATPQASSAALAATSSLAASAATTIASAPASAVAKAAFTPASSASATAKRAASNPNKTQVANTSPAAAPGTTPAAASPVIDAAASAPATAQAAPGTDPKAACEGRLLFAYFTCVSLQCQRPVFRNHATCVEWRETERRRRDAENR